VGVQAARPAGVMQLVLNLDPGGTERLAIELVSRLAGRYPMVVCCLDEPGAWAGEVTGRGVPVVALGRAAGFHPSLGLRIATLAEAHAVSVLHCHHYSPFVYGAIATLRRPGLRLVYTEHGRLSDAPPTRKRRLANTVLSRLAGPTFCVSAALRTHVVAEGFPRHRVGVIHNGIAVGPVPGAAERHAARAALGLDASAVVVGTAARLDPVKDLGALVAALATARAQRPDLSLVVVGDGPERVALEAAAHAQGVAGAVQFTGYRVDVRQLLPAFDLYVNCSVSEGVSLTILEAMAAGLPVVATSVGGTPEVVVDGSTGRLVPARAPAALSAALLALAGDEGLRRQWGAAGRSRVESAFTIERMTDDYVRVYDRLLTGQP